MRFVLLLLVSALSVPSYADTYKWVDDKGVVNFTDNRESIPAKYRKRTQELPSVKAVPQDRQPVKGEKSTETAESQTAASGDSAVSSKDRTLYGGHDGEWWSSRFGSLREEMKELQDNLPKKREELTELKRKLKLYTYARNRVAYQEKAAEIREDEDRITELADQLSSLDNEAARAGVPFEFRK